MGAQESRTTGDVRRQLDNRQRPEPGPSVCSAPRLLSGDVKSRPVTVRGGHLAMLRCAMFRLRCGMHRSGVTIADLPLPPYDPLRSPL